MILAKNIAGFWLVRFHGHIWNTGTPDIRLAIEFAIQNEKFGSEFEK